MITFTIEVAGDTETRYNTLTGDKKLFLKAEVQTYIAGIIKDVLRDQEQEEDVTDDVTITVA